ncbi:MAG: Leucyl/phenylalanyl-tRNA--protein transferase [Verrucomicrobiota bacterium]|jgi:leucyl/phenylalanyl-tRNA--protein transferase
MNPSELTPELLIDAYVSGVFPMGSEDGIEWYSPDPRGIIPLDAFHIPHGLQRALKKQRFEVRFNTSFREVMQACAERPETWITEPILETYCTLHHHGLAHSVEAWREDSLVGGLYGVALRGAFFGESMFHRETDASKIALVGLVHHLQARHFVLLDTQWTTPHLETFGACAIPKARYLKLLTRALATETDFRMPANPDNHGISSSV